ncbi:vitamin K epoxide reductase family protein [Fodinibius salsisoli]|uniref:Vitamin K epoxide reductase family protein n=1 Tax=Fodinibius salsisoli TaxID=2820877 RepID=A0ABT3PJX6_9BACT|nr:vitamin K epoxide reductase family protein [Fodinibius salsisoli]MCW9706165.1 vitamin K epoxide reductase family protein [Fodinibius salsisoli]
MERLGINYKAARIKKEDLDRVESPYLFWSDEDSREPIIVRGQRNFPVNGRQDPRDKGAGEQAIILKAEPTDTIGDPKNEKQRANETFQRVMTGILLTALIGLILLTSIPAMSWMYGFLLLTALGGTTTGYLLIAKDIGITYDRVEAFCNTGRKTNCDRILSSEEANIFGGITLSDAASSYFLFQTLMIGLFIPLSGSIVSYYGVLALLSVLAIPAVIYSFYYQKVKAETWCRLCLIVDGILIIQAALFGYMYSEGMISFEIISTSSVILTLFLVAVIGTGKKYP